jgi:hypothetical protein
MLRETWRGKKVNGKRMKGCKKKPRQASFKVKISLAIFFSTKSSSHGEELKQQEKTKKKKNGRMVVGRNPWNCF